MATLGTGAISQNELYCRLGLLAARLTIWPFPIQPFTPPIVNPEMRYLDE